MTTHELKHRVSRGILEAIRELHGPTDVATPTQILEAVENALRVLLDHVDPEEDEK